jgi:hypothetical protein
MKYDKIKEEKEIKYKGDSHCGITTNVISAKQLSKWIKNGA